MPPSQRVQVPAYDKVTDASTTAISSGSLAAMALDPQAKMQKNQFTEGTDWLRNLQKAAGFTKNDDFAFNEAESSYANGIAGEFRDLWDEVDADSEVSFILLLCPCCPSAHLVFCLSTNHRRNLLLLEGKEKAESRMQRQGAARLITMTLPLRNEKRRSGAKEVQAEEAAIYPRS